MLSDRGQPDRTHQHQVVDLGIVEQITGGLLERGWAVIDDAVRPSVIASLRSDMKALDPDDFGRAGVGRGDAWRHADDVRRDRVHWLDPSTDASRWYFDWIESLRVGLNRNLFLGLFDYECHYAWYAPGDFYASHVDAFLGEGNRKVSTVLYLNDAWDPADGGELVLYQPLADQTGFDGHTTQDLAQVVCPTGGTLVCFLSEEIPHEVRATATDRFSIAGWFRVKPTS